MVLEREIQKQAFTCDLRPGLSASINPISGDFSLRQEVPDNENVQSISIDCRVPAKHIAFLELLIRNGGYLESERVSKAGWRLIQGVSRGDYNGWPIPLISVGNNVVFINDVSNILALTRGKTIFVQPPVKSNTSVNFHGVLTSSPRYDDILSYKSSSGETETVFGIDYSDKDFIFHRSQRENFRRCYLFLREVMGLFEKEKDVVSLIKFLSFYTEIDMSSEKDQFNQKIIYGNLSVRVLRGLLNYDGKVKTFREIAGSAFVEDSIAGDLKAREEYVGRVFYHWVAVFKHIFPDIPLELDSKFQVQHVYKSATKQSEMTLTRATEGLQMANGIMAAENAYKIFGISEGLYLLWLSSFLGRPDELTANLKYRMTEKDRKDITIFIRGFRSIWGITLENLRRRILLSTTSIDSMYEALVSLEHFLETHEDQRLNGELKEGYVNALRWFQGVRADIRTKEEQVGILQRVCEVIKKGGSLENDKRLANYFLSKKSQVIILSQLINAMVLLLEGQTPQKILAFTDFPVDVAERLCAQASANSLLQLKKNTYFFRKNIIDNLQRIIDKVQFPNAQFTKKDFLTLIYLGSRQPYSSAQFLVLFGKLFNIRLRAY